MTIGWKDVIRSWAPKPSSHKNTTPSSFNTFRIDLIQNRLDLSPVMQTDCVMSLWTIMVTRILYTCGCGCGVPCKGSPWRHGSLHFHCSRHEFVQWCDVYRCSWIDCCQCHPRVGWGPFFSNASSESFHPWLYYVRYARIRLSSCSSHRGRSVFWLLPQPLLDQGLDRSSWIHTFWCIDGDTWLSVWYYVLPEGSVDSD